MEAAYFKGVPIESNTDEWHRARLGHFTSSKCNVLFVSSKTPGEHFGVGAKTYIREKASEILTGQQKEEITGVKAVDWGIANEPDAARLYSIVTNQKLIHSGFYEYSKVFGGTPDREVKNNPKLILEIKCPFVTTNFLAGCRINSGEELKKFDADHFAQCQANMLITNAEMCDYVLFDPRILIEEAQLKIIRVDRDQDFIDKLLERLDLATDSLREEIEMMLEVHERNLKYRIAS